MFNTGWNLILILIYLLLIPISRINRNLFFHFLYAAYGISPDRNLRDKQCTMRINARANPPTAPQFSLPSQPPSKCLDINTNSNNKAEENSDSENSKSINIAKKKWLNLKTAAGARDETNKSPDTAE